MHGTLGSTSWVDGSTVPVQLGEAAFHVGDPAAPDQELRRWRIWRQQAAAKCWYRLELVKSENMIWLGHLDQQRQLQLALQRSGLPVAYSKGYHPHPLMKFGPPLPVGVEAKIVDSRRSARRDGEPPPKTPHHELNALK